METDQSEKAVIVGSHKNDGTIEISFTPNDLEARAVFHPPVGEGQPITPDYIATVLERLTITFGLDWDAIQQASMESNLNRKMVSDIIIARGEPPIDEIKEYFQTNPAFRTWPKTIDQSLPRIDYREISPFILVRKGQILAKLRPRVEGKEGTNVHGQKIPKNVIKKESASNGPNTRLMGDVIVAATDGRLVENGTELSVAEILEVKGSVGYKTGHILFPGDVVIEGTVADGFKVYAGGSIVSKQTFDATDVVAKKDMIVAGGLIGRGKASVRVGGCLRAKFIQNCRVAGRGEIMVAAAVVNSRIYTLKKLDLGDKGRIIGGEIFAVEGVKASGIGSESGEPTKLHCGVDFTVQQELDRANERLRILSQKLTKLHEMMSHDSDADPVKLELENKLLEESERVRALIAEQLGKLDSFDDAIVEVSGELRAGTLIEICHIAYFADQNFRKVRFRLDKEHGRLVHENL